MSEISPAEIRVCEQLGPLLRAASVGDSLREQPGVRDLLSSFEYFLPELFVGIHEEWYNDFLDGVYAREFGKTGEREAELVGLAIFISDQTLTPLHVQLQVSPQGDRLSWIDCRLGEHTESGLRREPFGQAKVQGTMLHVLERLQSIDWYYHVVFGERQG